MIRINCIKTVTVLLTSIAMLIFVSNAICVAESEKSTISGRVINENGEPIVDATVVLLYVKLREYGGLDPLYDKTLYPFMRQDPPGRPPHFSGKIPDEQELKEQPAYHNTQSDSEGNFTISGILPGTVQFTVLPDGIPQKDFIRTMDDWRRFRSPPEIKAIKFGIYYFYPHQFSFSPDTGAVTFAISPGKTINNVEIIMKSTKHIRSTIGGRILFKNGTPLANTYLHLKMGILLFGDISGALVDRSVQTDDSGKFSTTFSVPGIYTFSVKYQGLSSVSELIIMKDREDYDGVVLTLSGNSEDMNGEKQKGRVVYGIEVYAPSVWVVNPDNGHSYKAIRCRSRAEAQTIAETEQAHLATITSEKEQVWLEVVFADVESWIGLKYVVFGDKWMWETGEPLDYTNWTKEMDSEFGFGGPPDRKLHYGVMTTQGLWKKVVLEDESYGHRRIAILEKDGLKAIELVPLE